jgi:hypothetical protein
MALSLISASLGHGHGCQVGFEVGSSGLRFRPDVAALLAAVVIHDGHGAYAFHKAWTAGVPTRAGQRAGDVVWGHGFSLDRSARFEC